jgi:hypothetical protein
MWWFLDCSSGQIKYRVAPFEQYVGTQTLKEDKTRIESEKHSFLNYASRFE